MSNDVAIKVETLTKIYKLYDSPQDRLKESINPFGRKYHRDFYALNDVSFEIRKGETVGIIGRNGCGKSTLLKIITGVLTPNSGTATVDGNISALLELSAGFNPQLTGLENVYFNGTILGYTREEIDEKLDGILSFADIGHFVHQPVKTYSSGMFIRLAFAVAISVDPDILIVDEALAVGDEAFQRKCYSRIKDFQKRGKTILFVSHSAGTIVELCQEAILIDQGEILLTGTPKSVVSRYQKLIYAPSDKIASLRQEIRGAKHQGVSGQIHAVSEHHEEQAQRTAHEDSHLKPMYDPHLKPKSTVAYESRGAYIDNPVITTIDGKQVNVLVHGEEYLYSYTVNFEKDAHNVRFGMLFKTTTGFELGGIVSHSQGDGIEYVEKGAALKPRFKFKCTLLPGTYFLNSGLVGMVDGAEVSLHRILDIVMFRVQPEPELLVNGIVDFSPSPSAVKGADAGSEVLYVERNSL